MSELGEQQSKALKKVAEEQKKVAEQLKTMRETQAEEMAKVTAALTALLGSMPPVLVAQEVEVLGPDLSLSP